MRSFALSIGLAAALLASSSQLTAQFSQFTWTLSDAQGGLGDVGPTGMGLHGFLAQPGSTVKFTTTTHVAGRVACQVLVMPEDGFCGGGGSQAQYLIGSSVHTFASCFYSGGLSFDVADGQSFGFALQTFNTAWPYSCYYSDFSFTPYWTPLGGAMAGTAGAPLLAGVGIIQPGQIVRLVLDDAKPAASTFMVVGLSELNAAFKGGVMVPALDLLIPGLLTDAAGQLALGAVFPPGIPPHVSFTMQAWIVDAAGPAGFAASNAVRGTTL